MADTVPKPLTSSNSSVTHSDQPITLKLIADWTRGAASFDFETHRESLLLLHHAALHAPPGLAKTASLAAAYYTRREADYGLDEAEMEKLAAGGFEDAARRLLTVQRRLVAEESYGGAKERRERFAEHAGAVKAAKAKAAGA